MHASHQSDALGIRHFNFQRLWFGNSELSLFTLHFTYNSDSLS